VSRATLELIKIEAHDRGSLCLKDLWIRGEFHALFKRYKKVQREQRIQL
jgi:hypothetical protein